MSKGGRARGMWSGSFLRHSSFESSRARGALPVVLLPGGLGRAETVEPALSFLSPRRPAFAVGYALGVHDPHATADWIAGSLKMLHLGERVHLVGFSMGAQVARLVAIARPEFVASVVLVGAGAPDPERARRIERALPLLRLLPAAVWRRCWRREFAAVLDAPAESCQPGGCGISVKDVFEKLLAEMTRREFVDCRERLIALDRLDATEFAGRSVPDSIPLLRLDLGDDRVISSSERERIARLEPHAIVETLPGLGHGALLTLPAPLLARLDAWLSAHES